MASGDVSSIYIKIGVQMFVCLLVCGGPMEIPTPARIMLKFFTHVTPVQGRFWCRFDPCSLPYLSLGSLKP